MTNHLSYSERNMIERCLINDKTFSSIAKVLERSPSTISREVLKHRAFVNREAPDSSRDCVYYHSCTQHRICHTRPTYSCMDRCKFCSDMDCRLLCKRFKSSHCERLNKPPYVCSGCPLIKSCLRNHAYYTANRAEHMAQKQLSQSRSGFHTSPEELERIGNIIEPLLKRGQSLNHIYKSHQSELGVSIRTIYNYIDSGAMNVRNIDLPKKVVYRNRRKKKVLTRMEYRYREGRTYADFKAFMELNPQFGVIEMDTVKGARGCYKVLLTFILPGTDFFLAFLMPHGGEKDVLHIFDYLTRVLGLETFRTLFPVILTDNGVEFKNPEALEVSETGLQRTRIFYCDPMCPTQKPRIEKAHVLLRRIIPKKTSFAFLNQEMIHLCVCHLNSFIRDSIDNKAPFELMQSPTQKKLLEVLDLSLVPPDEVRLHPTLLKQ